MLHFKTLNQPNFLLLCPRWVISTLDVSRGQIRNPWGRKTINRAFIHDPTTFGYLVMIYSRDGWRPSWILPIWWPQVAPRLAPSKNEKSMCCSTCGPNLVLVDKSAQLIPKSLDYTGIVPRAFWHCQEPLLPALNCLPWAVRSAAHVTGTSETCIWIA